MVWDTPRRGLRMAAGRKRATVVHEWMDGWMIVFCNDDEPMESEGEELTMP